MKSYYVYIMVSDTGTFNTSMTRDLKKRVYEHQHTIVPGFAKQSEVDRLDYYEETKDIGAAIAREKQIKGWRRSKKTDLLTSLNPKWEDLSKNWF